MKNDNVSKFDRYKDADEDSDEMDVDPGKNTRLKSALTFEFLHNFFSFCRYAKIGIH